MDNLELYNKVKAVPKEAQKTITGGRMNGKTDINPMWRIKTLTENFGPCGIGWYYEIIDTDFRSGAGGEVAVFVTINMYVKHDGEWSKPIQGTGGNMFLTNEKSGLRTSDEAIKMALTDAISVSCKALGVGAEVYWDKDKTKYDGQENRQPVQSNQAQGDYEKNVKILLGMIAEAKDEKQLVSIWNLNKDYQKDSAVLSALKKRKEELKQKQDAA